MKRAEASRRRESIDWRSSMPSVGNEDGEDNVTDLILIIHGIGQGVWDSLVLCKDSISDRLSSSLARDSI